jgi:hypothetical protein
MDHAHAELRQRAQERELFGRQLAGAEERDRLRTVLVLDGAKARHERVERFGPRDWLLCAVFAAQERRGRAVIARKHRQRFPAFGTRLAQVHRVVRRGRRVDRDAVFNVHVEAAAGAAEAADHGRGLVGREPRRSLA